MSWILFSNMHWCQWNWDIDITHLSDYISTKICNVCVSLLKERDVTKDKYAEETFR